MYLHNRGIVHKDLKVENLLLLRGIASRLHVQPRTLSLQEALTGHRSASKGLGGWPFVWSASPCCLDHLNIPLSALAGHDIDVSKSTEQAQVVVSDFGTAEICMRGLSSPFVARGTKLLGVLLPCFAAMLAVLESVY